jgi:ABC-2 type transport system ATP-binding protein
VSEPTLKLDPRPAAGALVVAEALNRRFGTTLALQGLSLTLEPGELFGLVGPDGAGKTTTIRVLSGLIGRDGGSVRVAGADPLMTPAVRDILGVMPQHYSLYGDLSVAENLRFFGRLYALPKQVYRERVDRLLEITHLRPFTERRASALSGGMYKKLALACALLHEPRVLLLDEPTNGVDPVSRRELWELLGQFVGDGMSVLIATAYMDEAARCHRVGLLNTGRLLACGRPEQLVRELEHSVFEVRGGERARADALLATYEGVLACSPVGERLRVVCRRGAEAGLAALLLPLSARLERVTPDFEDVFLALTHEPPPEVIA